MFDQSFIPQKPFPAFKWRWATFAPTESINDPVVLLGVLFRMEKLEGHAKYSSQEFEEMLNSLQNDIKDSIGVNLAGRGGERNIMRNSSQYWKALNLIPKESHGVIELTDFGRKVARHELSQTDFSATTIATMQLPNARIEKEETVSLWNKHNLRIYPLRIILTVCQKTEYITPEELQRIVIPLSAESACRIEDYVNFIQWYREGLLDVSKWPDCCPEANDRRMAREFLLFLSNYGYMNMEKGKSNATDKYFLNTAISDEIASILEGEYQGDVISDVERKRMKSQTSRPRQAQFRKEVLAACKRCIITNVTMPEVLEAAHIKPYKYHGEDTAANGFAMRMDIHMLFDTGHLRIAEDGRVDLSNRARMDYGALIPPRIVIPDFINRDFLRWRWENYNGN